MHADVRTLDPHWTTQTIAGIHGMLIYDTLFGVDDDGMPHPQMVGDYTISDDRLEYSFTLRDGLKFHDGADVTTADVLASLKRWGTKDQAARAMFAHLDTMEAVDDKTFTMKFKAPYGLVLDTLGKTGTMVPIIMRASDATMSADEQVTEAIGSGPFMMVKEEWVPGSRTVYRKNPDYVPREGEPSGFSGAKIPKVDKIELVWIDDSQTRMQALIALSKLVALVNAGALTIGRWLGAFCILLMVIIILTQVFFRYVIGLGLPWPEEAARFLMLWSAGLMIGTAYRRGGFVAIDLMVALLPRLLRHLLTLTLFALALIVLWKAWQIGLREVSGLAGRFGTDSLNVPTSWDLSTWRKVPKSWQMMSMLVGIGALIIVTFELILREVIALFGHAGDLPPISDQVVLGSE
jgi:TRAP-type C4-dicarboxylate transport system permease small subunit